MLSEKKTTHVIDSISTVASLQNNSERVSKSGAPYLPGCPGHYQTHFDPANQQISRSVELSKIEIAPLRSILTEIFTLSYFSFYIYISIL